ncbi:putative outer membrane usher protein ycbS [Salmonella enterica subsp. arizonae]|uniref:Putative outer membrane usher protein ycbS n=1 Tax=Salmonella enterica subsp. arizonae TaxID=59203 RepID=A0A379THL3_SALER|nr:putative outer membrane usher protein ycbS [Salmonella enterica subsp. arizonae]
MLKNMGVNTGAFPLLATSAAGSCPDLASAIPAARTRFDFAQQRLDISIPQAAMITSARGYIPPQYWDEGINALLLNYTFTGANSRDRSADGGAENSYFLGLNSGLNLGGLGGYATIPHGTRTAAIRIATATGSTSVPIWSAMCPFCREN